MIRLATTSQKTAAAAVAPERLLLEPCRNPFSARGWGGHRSKASHEIYDYLATFMPPPLSPRRGDEINPEIRVTEDPVPRVTDDGGERVKV